MFLVAQEDRRLSRFNRARQVTSRPFNRSHDFPGDHFQLRRHREFVTTLDSRGTTAAELLRPTGSQHRKFECADLVWAIDHGAFLVRRVTSDLPREFGEIEGEVAGGAQP